MNFTEQEIENIFDHIKSAGFDVPDDWDSDKIALLSTAILEALHLDRVERI